MAQPLSVTAMMEFSDGGPVTRTVMKTDRTIVLLVCLKPGQAIPAFAHSKREAFVYCIEGGVRITPGDGPVELRAGMIACYDGSIQAAPHNPEASNAAFLVTLVRKKGD